MALKATKAVKARLAVFLMYLTPEVGPLPNWVHH
jgi:hypothetical protein